MKFLHPSPQSSSRGVTILRVVFGALMVVHGLQKLMAGHAAFAASVAAMGVQKPELIAWLVIAGELGLGTLLVLGALTRVAGFLAAILFASIWFVTEAGKPLLTDASGVTAELLIVYFAISVAFVFLGPGALSLDRKLARQPVRSR
ncbi:DoxX family protein [Paenarthrobacter nitroguajacolicus]|uniref:DoxX family protein n=1 Tax=Paenarthrobacter nitroguajacolicus TaxID=211146 RepID=UPI00285AB371|nr:DoxX family protein [Paenarthrobacter nitroguajacolicus]MDR6637452.1 putative oxidoreductase [Paenarthrobacter nitroguajacolicus]